MAKDSLIFYRSVPFSDKLIPYFENGLKAGFPSPADDYSELKIDLNVELIRNKDATFFARVNGDSMIDAGFKHGDILVIDRSIEACNNKIVVCILDGGFTVKRLKIENNECWLIPENEKFEPVKITEENDFQIWGVVTFVIKAV